MSASWNASLPTTGVGTWPVIATIGTESILASASARDQVAAAGAGRRHAHARPCRSPRRSPRRRGRRPARGGTARAGSLRVEQRVVGRQDRAAGDAEDDVDALALERLEQRLRAGDLHLAATSSVRRLDRDPSRRASRWPTGDGTGCGTRARTPTASSRGGASAARRRACSSPKSKPAAQVDDLGGEVAVDGGAHRGLGDASTVTWPGPSHSTLATTVPSRSNSYRISGGSSLGSFPVVSVGRVLGRAGGWKEKPPGWRRASARVAQAPAGLPAPTE